MGSAPPSRDYEYVAHLSNRKECPKAIHRKIRPSSGRNNESSWVWGEDGYYHPPHELTTGGRSAKSHVCNWYQMTSYRRARWCIRNIFSKFRAFSKRPLLTKNIKFLASETYYITYTALTLKFGQNQVLTNIQHGYGSNL